MKKAILFPVLLFLCRGSSYAQADTMSVELSSSVKKYQVADIVQITFRIDPNGISEDELSKMNEILNSFALQQNYPNPFNPSTNISYRLPKRGEVQVRIYDLNGRLIKEILSTNQERGEYTVQWDAKSSDGITVSSGVYFYQVQFDNSILTKKMIFLK